MPAESDTRVRIVRIPKPLRERAAARLVAQAAGDGDVEAAGRRFLEAAGDHGIDLHHFWGSLHEPSGLVGQVCLVAPGAGRVGMTFTSQPEGPEEEAELSEVIRKACDAAESVDLAQGLLDPLTEVSAEAAYAGAGFQRLGRLLYLTREWKKPEGTAPPLPEGVTVEGYAQCDDAQLAEALEASYIDTLDCPELCGLRDIDDVIASHRSTGEFDPDIWWIVKDRGTPCGALLLNACPVQCHIELVYMGLGPSLRGRGIASHLMHLGLTAISRQKNRTVTCAVDERNDPARRFYAQHGFVRFGERTALIRSRRAASVENG